MNKMTRNTYEAIGWGSVLAATAMLLWYGLTPAPRPTCNPPTYVYRDPCLNDAAHEQNKSTQDEILLDLP